MKFYLAVIVAAFLCVAVSSFQLRNYWEGITIRLLHYFWQVSAAEEGAVGPLAKTKCMLAAVGKATTSEFASDYEQLKAEVKTFTEAGAACKTSAAGNIPAYFK